ncbi:hypothetical protein CYMTET_48830 [Cymbomonas tetramitiformis]|uniref:Uncharacterized protein n=1 Tax=Cymbomonas tetramitiformis TaxID=36881 RepID=A0AAE0EVB9_9CHLO|nr:hypothetical protein CYMTET_48830 [Cymbomonas tetramitiformis]
MTATQQQQIAALMDIVKILAGIVNALQQANQNSTVPADVPDMSTAVGRQSLPTLSETTKGLPAGQYFSGEDDESEGVWLEWKAKIGRSMRHPSLALLLSEVTPANEIKGDPIYLESANQLFYDFLCRVTTKTANGVVRSFFSTSDGYPAWQGLVKLRRNTTVVYFTAQVHGLFAQAKQFATLTPPFLVRTKSGRKKDKKESAGDSEIPADQLALAQENKTKGIVAFSAGQYMEAVKYFTQAINHNPKDHVFYYNRSACYASLDKYKEASADALQCTTIAPGWAKGYFRLGLAYFKMKEYNKALKAYETGVSIDPSNTQLLERISEIRRTECWTLWTLCLLGMVLAVLRWPEGW